MTEGAFRHRTPPPVTWDARYGEPTKDSVVPSVIMGAKGLIHVLYVKPVGPGNVVTNSTIVDVLEIEGIESLRKQRQYNEAIRIAYTQSDFQGKRIIQLMIKDNSFTPDEKKLIENTLKRGKESRVGRWDLDDLLRVLEVLCIISKDEYLVLDELRLRRNDLEHVSLAPYRMNVRCIDEILKLSIQALLRMAELPVPLTTEITGKEFRTFWRDLGYEVK